MSTNLPRPDPRELLKQTLERVDGSRAEALDRAETLQTARAESARRERDRLAKKYGAAHPRVVAAASRAAKDAAFLQAVATQAAVAREIERPRESEWLVHGRVLDSAGAPRAGVRVSLVDANGGEDVSLGDDATRATGYYALRGQGSASGAGMTRHLSVGDASGKELFRDPRPLEVRAGATIVREIVLPAGSWKAPPPPTVADAPGATAGGAAGRGGWTVRGRVTDAAGTPVPGAIVSLFDADLLFDDRLGETITDDAGEYVLSYGVSDFRDFIERRPDLYVKVMDRDRRVIFSTHANLRFEAGRSEVLDIRLDRES